MDEVIEAHDAKRFCAGVVGDELLSVGELPVFCKVLVRACGDGRAAFSGGLVEAFKRGGNGGPGEVGLGPGGVGEIHAFVFHNVETEQRKAGTVHGKFAEFHGFFMRSVVAKVVSEAFDCAASVQDLGVEVEEEKFGYCHGFLSVAASTVEVPAG